MDFMKVLDQAVREIKREVNLKVLKVPEIEQKVLDATNDEAWGPHGSALSEIAQATKKFTECQIVMEVLWSRLTDTGPNWRHVYKALTVIEYLLANGSERAVDDIIEHSFQISSLSSFEFVELSGKDVGINVRKKAETLLGLLNDKEKLQAARNKAAANRDKYVGLSSTGITYKSGSASYGSSQFSSNYSYKDHDQYGDDADWKNEKKDVYEKFQESPPKRGVTKKNRGSTKKPSAVHDASKSKQGNTEDDGFDDFDPRGSSTSDSKSFNQVDLFGDSLIGDLMDAPVASSGSASDDVDLFAGATFVSASPPHPEASKVFEKQDPVDLFGNQTAAPVSSPSNVDLFGASPAAPVSSSSNVDLFAAVPAAPVSSSSNVDPFATTPARSAVSSDPFAAVPLTAFEEPDAFGDFTSHTDSSSATAVNRAPKKGDFQVKSGIWADSLSRGLIDLNLTAPKKVSLSDVGVVGGSEEKRPPASAYGGFGSGSGVAQQQPFGGFY